MDLEIRALNRFGMGARVGERGKIKDPRNWLRSQLDPENARLADEAGMAGPVGSEPLQDPRSPANVGHARRTQGRRGRSLRSKRESGEQPLSGFGRGERALHHHALIPALALHTR